ncbi:S1 family peptidase [Nonomuraea sp. MG754425]|uniref:S1 family peptidase n=1 Tax=Nonomuraea sp. MG754425 TaxID=2570319 RepID=UPI001F1F3938|nr:S1 family peptidase [Nonomuraea sp. MG754425]MCF6474869.1 S1 family peptidase [Nonomuraea sp. MG754425]
MRITNNKALPVALLAASALVAGGLIAPSALGVAGGTGTEHAFVARIDVGPEQRGCSGTLVDPEWILTAKACASGAIPVLGVTPLKPIRASVGAAVDRPVIEILAHPDRDLALARLDKPVTGVTPVRIGTIAPQAGEALQVAGYGRTATEWAPQQAHSAAFTVQSVAAGTIDVAGDPATPAAVCQGDAGGPTLRQTGSGVELVAVSSLSWQGGCLGTPASETRRGAVQVRVDDADAQAWIRRTLRMSYVRLPSSAQVLDTRSGIGATAGTREAGSTTTFRVAGVGGIPILRAATAVLVDITAIPVAGAGTYLTAFPTGSPPSDSLSMVNAMPGQIISNTAVVPVGPDGTISVRTHRASDIAVDVQGYYTRDSSGGGFVPLDHTRLADTRAAGGTIPARGSRTFAIATAGGVIPAGASAAFLDVVVVDATAGGWLGAYQTGGANNRSVMDFVPGDTAHAVTVKLGTDGRATFTNNSSAPIHLALTATGYHTADAASGWGLRTAQATLLLDTRQNDGAAIASNAVVDVPLGLPAGWTALLNLTMVDNTRPGYLRAWPLEGTEPGTSLVNYPATADGVRSGLATVKVGTDGKVRIRNVSAGTTHLIASLQGWFAPPMQ